jgi:hypothetical protein|nr:MAG TPA: DNA-directed RNA polymerase [Caudoviricetes sp.]
MDDYISRKELIEHIKAHCKYCDGCGEVMHCAIDTPAADVKPVRHGHWIKRGYVCGENEYECSECHETEWKTSDSRMKWCMFCGAKMDGGEKDETQNLCKTVDGSGPLPE